MTFLLDEKNQDWNMSIQRILVGISQYYMTYTAYMSHYFLKSQQISTNINPVIHLAERQGQRFGKSLILPFRILFIYLLCQFKFYKLVEKRFY